MKTELLLLRDCSRTLVEAVRSGRSIYSVDMPPTKVQLSLPPSVTPEKGRVHLSNDSVREIAGTLALRCDYDTRIPGGESARHSLDVVAVAIQLVKPTRSFLDLWLQLDELGQPELITTGVRQLGTLNDFGTCLEYQQHNVLEESDVLRALGLVPQVAKALSRTHGSWEHPALPVHRALIFFCQGYCISPDDPRQFLWAAGLDCLYASKLDRKKQGSAEITSRMALLLGRTLRPYDSVHIPVHQKARTHLAVAKAGKDIFRLRNAFAHGLAIPDPGWLGQHDESSYAYQLMEQTEILLRLTLVKVLEKPSLFDIFIDPKRLDAYF